MSYFVLWCGHSRDSNGYYYVTALWVPYHIHTTWCDYPPCAELRFSTPHNTILLDNHHGDRQKKQKKTIPWLSSSRSDGRRGGGFAATTGIRCTGCWFLQRVMCWLRQPVPSPASYDISIILQNNYGLVKVRAVFSRRDPELLHTCSMSVCRTVADRYLRLLRPGFPPFSCIARIL